VLEAAVAAACLKPLQGLAQGNAGSSGCCILPDARGMFASPSAGNRPRQKLSPTELLRTIDQRSGQPRSFNRDLGGVLVSMARTFGERPGFGYYDDGRDLNAFATSATAVDGTGGTIAFGRNLLSAQLKIDKKGISVAAICAHEFAHVLQFRTALNLRLTERYPVYCRELHADYLAGFYLYWFQEERGSDLQGVGRAWEDMGPSRFTEDATHGTAAMRLDCIQQGYRDAYDFGSEGISDAAEEGFRYVARHVQS
jgi:hypothetical protein